MLDERVAERAAIDSALRSAGERRGRSVVVTGPPGGGLTALLEGAASAAEGAQGWLVVRARAAASEAGLDNAVLQQVVAPLVDELDRSGAAGGPVEAPARATLAAVTGWGGPDGLSVPPSVAVLWALETVARRRPVLVLVDDVQWADPPSLEVLRFLSRRLHSTAVCLVVAAPGAQAALEWPDADVVVDLPPLGPAASAALLDRGAPGTGPVARERLLRLAAGLPRRLVDLAHLAQQAAASGTGVTLRDAALPWVRRAREDVLQLPPVERRRLLLTGLLDDPAALAHLVEAERALAAQVTGSGGGVAPLSVRASIDLLDGSREEQPDPLLPQVVADAAEPAQRLAAHRSWVGVLDRAAAAAAADGRDEAEVRLAAEARRQEALALAVDPGAASAAAGGAGPVVPGLRRSAAVLVRHDPRRAGDLLVMAAQLDDDDDARTADLVRAAELAWAAGRTRLVEVLLERAGEPRTRLARGLAGRARALRSLACGEHDRGREELVRALGDLLLEARREDAGALADRARREAVATAAVLAVVAPRSATGAAPDALRAAADGLAEPHAGRVRSVAALLKPWRAASPAEQQEALVEALDTVDGAALPVLRWVTDAARSLGRSDLVLAVGRSRVGGLTGPAAVDLQLALCAASLDASITSAAEHAQAARAALRHAPDQSAAVAQAQAVIDLVRCQKGSDVEALLPSAEVLAVPTTETAGALWAVAHGHRLRGEVHAAAAALRPLWPAGGSPSAGALLGVVPHAHSVRDSGADPAELRALLAHAEAWAEGSGAPLARVSVLMCRALSSEDGREQQELLAAAAEQGGPALVTGTADLALGMLLRRARRAVDARSPLQRAVDAFAGAGMPGFARQAQRELAATAPQRPLRRVGSRELTSQEREVADLAAQGASNAGIAVSLGISSRTVAHHLQRVYAKLGVPGRRELAGQLERAGG